MHLEKLSSVSSWLGLLDICSSPSDVNSLCFSDMGDFLHTYLIVCMKYMCIWNVISNMTIFIRVKNSF